MYTFTSLFRGDSLVLQSGNVCASAWMDKRVVMVMSTGCNPLTAGTVQRKKKDGSRIQVPCPDSLVLYNKYMGGVDRGDQKRGYYSCRTKSRKLYKYIFYFLLDVAITYFSNSSAIRHSPTSRTIASNLRSCSSVTIAPDVGQVAVEEPSAHCHCDTFR